MGKSYEENLNAEEMMGVNTFKELFGDDGEWEAFRVAREHRGEIYESWLEGKEGIDEDVGITARKCAYYSPTWLKIMLDDPEESGGFISLAFTPFPHETKGFEEIYPQDIAIYCARIDAMRHPEHEDHIRGLFRDLHYDEGFQKFPKATAQLVVSGFINKLKAKVMFWRTPKWDRMPEGD